uniref:Importin N-terminal domain-containing protein n=1 Tax=Percolomonas cosmopolitus TaxID=63605 RepID=A0A7S1PI08_9EUKA|mmetsp:Transcript_6837/g.25549  ORF Transcript_6837/g.25549 Transcript_6837/m.25549 type:complete len:1065 (+) Transcript_6837:259-3453(+)
MASLADFESLCTQLYNPQQSQLPSNEIAAKLSGFKNPQQIPQLRAIIQQSTNQFALFFAGQTLKDMIGKKWNEIDKDEKVKLRNFLCTYIGNKGYDLPNHVKKEFYSVLGALVKLGWFEDQSNRDLPEQIKQYFIKPENPKLSIIGLQLLGSIIQEINSKNSKHSLSQHRKISTSFRDLALRPIFESALFAIKEVMRSPDQSDMVRELCLEALKLTRECLSFDFVGIFPYESTEDLGVVQIPAAWRPLLEDSNTVEIFWDIYNKFPDFSGKELAMQILVLLASVRRSLFSGEEEKVSYLSKFLNGVIVSLRNQTGLNNPDCYHQFCRLLPRLKTNFQLTEFVQCEKYKEWLDLTAKFTLESFKQWESASPKVYYILSLWMKLVASAPYVRNADQENSLESYVPEICSQFILTRLELAKGIVEKEGAIENPLEHEESLFEQMEAFPQLAHCDFEKTMQTFTSTFDPLYVQYRACIQNNGSPQEFEILEGQLAWLCYMFGSVLGRRHANASKTKESLIGDAELSARVVRVMGLISERLKNPNAYQSESVQRLELGTLKFLKQFKSIYLTDSKLDHSDFYERFKRLIQVDSELKCLNIVITKIANNLRIWAKSEKIIRKTLKLFESVTTGYSTSSMACKLESTQFMLKNHSPDTFSFLNEPMNLRHRMLFYRILTRVLFNRDGGEEAFIQFLQPIDVACAQIMQVQNPQELTTPQGRFALAGLFRDLRGICWACINKDQYGYFFDWLHPNRIVLLHKVVQYCYQYQDVMTPLLQFLCEFVLNRGHRQKFGTSSPKGIILFKELSKILVVYGRQLPNLQVPSDKEYEMRYKPISMSVLALMRSMSGDYCNFGVFELYNDSSLTDSLSIFIQLILKIPPENIKAYPKLKTNYFGLLEVLFSNFLSTIIKFDSAIFSQLLSSMEYGITDEDTSISTGVCSALNNLCDFYISNTKTKKTQDGEVLQKHLQQNPAVFHRILQQFFRLMMYEECSNQWSISRAMLSLIVIDPGFFEQLRMQIIGSIPDDERRVKLQEAFVELMKDVEYNLTTENKDTFTSNMITFRNTCKALL